MEVVYGTATKLVELLGSTAYEEISLAWGVNEELKKLRETLSIIHAVLLDAEERQTHSQQIKTWLAKLKDVLVDAEVLLDEFECEDLRNKVVKKHGTIGRKVRRFFSRSNPLVFQNCFGHKIKDIQKELHKIAALKTEFGLQEGDRKLIPRETHSCLTSHDLVIGRDADKERIIELLFKLSDNQSVIPIQGMGGLGKTTLAKFVYNDKRVEEHFDLKMWLRNKRFLLVLDDVWSENCTKWIELKGLLMEESEGSKIIVTTRKSSVAERMGDIEAYHLEGLCREDFRSLFVKCAFKDGEEK
ncbi:hypothetical protein UlMin_010875 [Ulmus minor]